MKRLLSCMLILVLVLGMLSGCGQRAQTPEDTETTAGTEPVLEGKAKLQGKKVIFIGNSFTYYGRCVFEKAQSEYGLEKRVNDMGYFHRICQENGVEVSVTNFTFGGHTLKDFYSGDCQADRGHNGLNHLDYLTDRNYDYVILQNGSNSASAPEILDECKPLMELFRKENPNVQFVFLVQHRVHSMPYQWRGSIKGLEEAGFIVVDWGAVVNDIITGAATVPGATESYDQNSFIISKSESDGFHPNMLTGYITALMTYCAITGEKAEGQVYDFGENDILFGTNALSAFRGKQYTYNRITNFDKILRTEADMRGIQKLIDQYLAEKAYRNY